MLWTVAQRLAVLEDICRRKDSAIQELKEEIIALEDKVKPIPSAHSSLCQQSPRNELYNLQASTSGISFLYQVLSTSSRAVFLSSLNDIFIEFHY